MVLFKKQEQSAEASERLRRRGGGGATLLTLGERAAEFGDEGLDLVDRSNAAALRRKKIAFAGHPPHGVHRRAVHPHGELRRGTFHPTGAAGDLTDAHHLDPQEDGGGLDALVRYSNFMLPMNRPDIMGLAVKIDRYGEVWDMAATSVPQFVAGNIAAFRSVSELATHPWRSHQKLQLMARSALSGASFPGVLRLVAAQARRFPGRKGREQSTYWGVHTFWFTKAGRQTKPFKYRWEPDARTAGVFHLYADVVDPSWKYLCDAAKTLPGRTVEQTLVLGTLRIGETIDGCEDGCDDVLFNPTRLPQGIVASNDEILFMRGGAYPASYLRRTSKQAGQP